jgi:hypothetical protein
MPLTEILQTRLTTYRVIVSRRRGSELLLIPHDHEYALPSVEVAHDQRVAETLCAEFEKRWNFEALCLFAAGHEGSDRSPRLVRYHVMAPVKPNANAPQGMFWIPVASLTHAALASSQDLDAIVSSARELQENGIDTTRGPFSSAGWLRELFDWVADVIGPDGLRLTGRFSQLNASRSFSLIRIETTGSALWFKAVAGPQRTEFPVSNALARLFPGFVPSIVANRPDWNGWLMKEVSGRHLNELSDAPSWERTAESLARLQIESITETTQLLESGCKDLTIPVLLGQVDLFMNVIEGLMECQRTTARPRLSRAELRTLGTEIVDALLRLERIAIPYTLGHQDFNPGNILVSSERCVFLDWAEASIGPPLFTFQCLMEHLRKLCPAESAVSEAQAAAAYARQWTSIISAENISEALALSRLVSVFAYAISATTWRDDERAHDSENAGYLRALTRRMKREAELIPNREVPCHLR